MFTFQIVVESSLYCEYVLNLNVIYSSSYILDFGLSIDYHVIVLQYPHCVSVSIKCVTRPHCTPISQSVSRTI